MASKRTERLLRGLSKDTRAVVRQCVRTGWTLDGTGSGHVRLTHPSGSIITVASSPSDWRALQDLKARVRRAEKGTTTQ